MNRILRSGQVSLHLGDITQEAVDAIVNAANSSLMGGGGVDGAIHRAGGPDILAACRDIVARIGELSPGKAVITSGGLLPARFVIHTVGPIWRGGGKGEAHCLASCYQECLTLARSHGLRRVSFPSISTGAYGYPLAPAAGVAMIAVAGWLNHNPDAMEAIRFILFDATTFNAYSAALTALPEG